jgi:hypothetical protein
MRTTSLAITSAIGLALFAVGPSPGAHSAAAPSNCSDDTGAIVGDGGFSDYSGKTCDTGSPGSAPSGGSSGPAPVVKTVDCGPPQVSDHLRPAGNTLCQYLGNTCSVPSAALLPKDPHATTTVTIRQNPDGTWTQIGYNCAATSTAPHLTAELIRQQVEKLVPHPHLGIAPPGGSTLVNLQTLLWIDTPADQPLGTVTLLGHQVALRIHITRVDWDFGDGTTDTTTGPQRRYDPADGCHTATCPGYWGHTYTHTGTVTVAATLTWTGQYQVDDGTWQTITGTVTAPAAGSPLTIRQARGILVPPTR